MWLEPTGPLFTEPRVKMRELKHPPYKSENGAWYTRALFRESMLEIPRELWPIKPIFTLNEDREGYISCRKTFVDMEDPTGYSWAMKYLGDWNHWLKLMKTKYFQEAYGIWMEELNMKLKSRAIAKITEIANQDTGPTALQASKYVAEKGWDKHTKGRPTKEQLARELKEQVRVVEAEDEDMQRIGLKVINGNSR